MIRNCILVVLVCIIATQSAHALAPEFGIPRREHAGLAAVVLKDSDPRTRKDVIEAVRQNGGQISLFIAPNLLIGWLPEEAVGPISAHNKVRQVSKRPFLHGEAAVTDPGAAMGINYFNWVASGAADLELKTAPTPHPLLAGGDVLGSQHRHTASSGTATAQNVTTSTIAGFKRDHFSGDIQVNLFYLQYRRVTSTNPDGTPVYDYGAYGLWSEADKQDAFNRVVDGLNWWSARLVNHFGTIRLSAPPMFGITTYMGYEDISEPASTDIANHYDLLRQILMRRCDNVDQCAWVVGGSTGYVDFDKFNDTTLGTFNHAFTGFIAHNPPGAPTQFPWVSNPNRHEAAAYADAVGGGYWISMWRPNGNASELAPTVAHETAHLFWACDEYQGGGGSTSCAICDASGPRPGATNGNSDAGSGDTCMLLPGFPSKSQFDPAFENHRHTSIMKDGGAFTESDEYLMVSQPTRTQIGWWEPECWNAVNWDVTTSTQSRTNWQGEYFTDTVAPRFPLVHWADAPDVTKSDGSTDGLDFDWGSAGPLTACMTQTHYYSVRWKRMVTFATAGTYRFAIDAATGYSLYVDGVLVSSQSSYNGPQTAQVSLTAGAHRVQLDYFDLTDSAKVHLSWTNMTCQTSATAAIGSTIQLCPGATGGIHVTINGGTGPYSVTLKRNDGLLTNYTVAGSQDLPVTAPTGNSFAAYTYTIANFADGSCPGAASGTATLNVSVNPYFVGTIDVNPVEVGCGLVVDWHNTTAASCVGDIVYDVVRIGPESTVTLARCLTGHSYIDSTATSASYTYLVYAEDAASDGGGACRGGRSLALFLGLSYHCPTTTLTLNAVSAGYGSPLTLTGTLSGNGIPLANESVSFTINGNPAGSGMTDVNGVATVVTTPALAAGTYTGGITASYSGDGGSESATSTIDLVIPKATPAVNWPAPAPVVYGTPLCATQLNATANISGAFAYQPGTGSTVPAGNSMLTTEFSPADIANFTTVTASAPITVIKAAQTILWPAPAQIASGTPISSTQLNATVSVVGPAPAGSLSYDVAPGTILSPGAHVLTATAAETANYLIASSSVTITVCAPPVITTAPSSSPSLINAGSSSTLSIGVTGDAPMTVQWYTSSGTAVTSPVSPAVTTAYYAVVSNACGSVQSTTVSVVVCVPPVLGTSPTATPSSIAAGQTSRLEMTGGTGTATLTYLWYKSDGTYVGSSTNKRLDVSPTVTTSYYYKVSNSCGTTGASPTVTVTVCGPATITSQPTASPASITSGGSATLSIGVTGTSPTIQWFTSSGASAGSGASITVSPTATTSYYATVTNACTSTLTSANVTVTVCVPAAISSQPAASPASIVSGGSATLSIGVTGTSPAIQWFTSSGTSVGSGTSITVSPASTTTYYALVSNACTSTLTSANVTVTVCAPPGISSQPTASPASVITGGSATLTIGVTGTALSVQWFTSTGTAVGTGVSINVSPTATTSYYAVVSNACGSVQSTSCDVSYCFLTLGTTLTATPSTITAGQTSSLQMGGATGTGTLTYLWYKSDGTQVGTSTNKKLNVTPAVTTSYYYKVSNSCGVTGPSPTVTVTVQ